MPLVNIKQTLAIARQGGWAVAAFNPVDYASMKAVIQAAADLEAPVIVQTSAKTVKFYGHETLAGWARELAGSAAVPVALHLDHGKDLKLAGTLHGNRLDGGDDRRLRQTLRRKSCPHPAGHGGGQA